MKFGASNKKWFIVVLAALMMSMCVLAYAQSYTLGDEADEIATIQTALKQLNLYSGEITGHYGSKTLSAVATFARVFAPAMPSAVRPFFFWKFMTAASVLEPKWPLIVPL